MPKKPEIITQRDEMVDQIFDMFDREGNGYIKVSSLKNIFYSIGRTYDENEIKAYLKENNLSMDGNISKKDFMDLLDTLFTVKDKDIDEVLEAFKVFDLDNSETITLKELKNVLVKYSKDFTEEECEELFKMIDKDGSGEISYEEFVNAWKFQ